jgi:hypothetical protein
METPATDAEVLAPLQALGMQQLTCAPQTAVAVHLNFKPNIHNKGILPFGNLRNSGGLITSV